MVLKAKSSIFTKKVLNISEPFLAPVNSDGVVSALNRYYALDNNSTGNNS